MTRIRRDVATLGGTWNPTLTFYALAIEAMQARPITDRTSWTYLGAIHGIDVAGWQVNGIIPQGGPLPPASETDGRMWNQCQHGSWYFLPWHRGYLHAFEDIVAKTVVGLGGPDDWALPYWNYFDDTNPDRGSQRQEFVDPDMPNGRPNPLARVPRHATQLNLADLSLDAMERQRFTGTLGFGGGQTSFSEDGDEPGAVESNPHNGVHTMIGGLQAPFGLMSFPDYAALDPIFWLHHCNVDRLWAAWLTRSGNLQENGAAWSDGPFPRRFELPDPSGNLAIFTPEATLPGGALEPTYDDLLIGTGAPTLIAGVGDNGDGAVTATFSSAPAPASRTLGSNLSEMSIGAAPSTTRIALDAGGATVAAAGRQRVFLRLQGIRGSAPSAALRVSLAVPTASAQPAATALDLKTISLFGLARASRSDGPHAGNGLGATVDITDSVWQLSSAGGVALDQIEVTIRQAAESPAADVTVEKVSVVSQVDE